MIRGVCHTQAETVGGFFPTLLLHCITVKPLWFTVLCPAITKLVWAPSFGAGAKAFGSGLCVCALDIPDLHQATATDEQGSRIWGGFFVPHGGTTQKKIPGPIQLVWPHGAGRGQDMAGVRPWAPSFCPAGHGCCRPWEFLPAVAEAPVTDLNIPELQNRPHLDLSLGIFPL